MSPNPEGKIKRKLCLFEGSFQIILRFVKQFYQKNIKIVLRFTKVSRL